MPAASSATGASNYHTAIFALNAAQRREAQAAVAEANRILRGRVVTPVRGAARFYPAEAYHQDYARRNPGHYNRYRARLRQGRAAPRRLGRAGGGALTVIPAKAGICFLSGVERKK